jgi:hypothetical protein
MSIVKTLLKLGVTAQLGAFLGAATRHQVQHVHAGHIRVRVGPLQFVSTNVLPAMGIGLLCGRSGIFSLLSGFVLGALVGDRLEPQ